MTKNIIDFIITKIPKTVHFTDKYRTNNTFFTVRVAERCIGSAGIYFFFPNE